MNSKHAIEKLLPLYLDFDRTNSDSILEYAKLLGKNKVSFQDMIDLQKAYAEKNELPDGLTLFKVNGGRGALGIALEECYFGKKRDNEQEPDFPLAGVELKSSPLDKKNNRYVPGERISITNLDINTEMPENFKESHVYKKLKSMLVVYYYRDKKQSRRWDFKIKDVFLYHPSENDMINFIEDYKYIKKKRDEGLFDKISEADTSFLGVCTKGKNKDSNYREQSVGGKLAQKRAFCLKEGFAEILYSRYIKPDPDLEKIFDEEERDPLTEALYKKVQEYRGQSDRELCDRFNVEYFEEEDNDSEERDEDGNLTDNEKKVKIKSMHSMLSFRMLGLKSNKSVELTGASIVVKSIRINDYGKMDESLSFPAFDFKELEQEKKWELSKIYHELGEKKYLFFVYKKMGRGYHFMGCQLWNMPYKDLAKAKKTWKETIEILRNRTVGLPESRNEVEKTARGYAPIKNNFPKEASSKVMHVRPHASKRYYRFKDGTEIGDNPSYGSELWDGVFMTKQSFWLNKDYVSKQISKDLKGKCWRKKRTKRNTKSIL